MAGGSVARPLPTLQVTRLESLIVDKICSLDYVSRAGYSDNGREVTILVIHDDNPDRDAAMVCEIGDRGREIEDVMPDRMISPLAIQNGSDMPAGVLCGARQSTREGANRGQAERPRRQSECGGVLRASLREPPQSDWPEGGPAVVPCAAQSRPPVRRLHGARPRQPRRRESASRERTAAGARRARQSLPDKEARTALTGSGQEMRAAGLPRGCRLEGVELPFPQIVQA